MIIYILVENQLMQGLIILLKVYTLYLNLKDQHDIKYHCAKLGLYPVRIRSEA